MHVPLIVCLCANKKFLHLSERGAHVFFMVKKIILVTSVDLRTKFRMVLGDGGFKADGYEKVGPPAYYFAQFSPNIV